MNATDFVRQGVRRGGIVGGIAGAATGAALGGLPSTYQDPHSGKTTKKSVKQRILSGAIGAGAMGYAGHGAGSFIGGFRNLSKWNTGIRPQSSLPSWLKGAKTKSEARKAYHRESRKSHPDFHANNPGAQKAQVALNKEWAEHSPFFKEAMLRGFADELEKIASV